MALRVVVAAAVSAALMFGWGFVYWGPVLDMTSRVAATLPAEVELDVLAPLRGANVPSGMYLYPGPLPQGADEATRQAWEAKLKSGPTFQLAFHKEGMSPVDPAMLLQGLAHNFVVALLAACLLALVVRGLPSFAGRAGLLLLATAMAVVWTNVGSAIWWGHAPSFVAGMMAYEAVAGALMALATAAIVRPRRPAAPGKS